MSLRIAAFLLAAGMTVMSMAADWENSGPMRALYQRYRADQGALSRMEPLDESSYRIARFIKFNKDWLAELDKVDFDALPPGGRADWVVLKNNCEYEIEDLGLQSKRLKETEAVLPFWERFVTLLHSRVEKVSPDGKSSAAEIDALQKEVAVAKAALSKSKVSEPVARRALQALDHGLDRFDEWYTYSTGYDPLFTWWVAKPYESLTSALKDLRKSVDDAYLGGQADAATAIKGDPIGEEGFKAELKHEMISYSVKDLIEIGKKEMAWCDVELKKASKELGYGDDWRTAMEHVKNTYVEPGKQPDMVKGLAEEAIAYVKKHDMVTVPPLAEETWRMVMMPPKRQLVSPFFLGGETIMVSYPTDTMTEEQKLMSMRANNPNFSKSTVFHELIPGHHLQQFMQSRYNVHRNGVSNTPFWVEGWALYWEFLFYKMKFPETPEQRIGFLFWRKHRAARIVFSLSYHLGLMTADQCVKMLVDDVGHEQSTAEGEVRRSLEGSYPPLYQAAYMLGAFQLWDIRRETVDAGKMTEKQLHDAVLQNGNMPWAVLRYLIEGKEIKKDFKFDWDFYKGSIPSTFK